METRGGQPLATKYIFFFFVLIVKDNVEVKVVLRLLASSDQIPEKRTNFTNITTKIS